MPDRWAGIVRVSHVGGRTGESFHADREQVEDLERAVALMPDAELVVLPPELDVSGGLPLERRPSLLAAVEGVERREYAGIIVSYLSRLGRSVREQLRAWDRVEAAGGRIIVVREGIDTRTAAGRLQRNLLLSIAEHEREAHAERFEDRRRHATQAGIWQRRQTPTGYQRHPRTRRLTPDDRAGEVQWAFSARAGGAPVSVIARRLGMTTSGVRQLLANRVYLGELRVGGHVNPEAHPPLVTVDEFDAARVPMPRPARSSFGDAPALLAGLVRCAGCGHVMTRHRTKRAVYGCPARHSGTACPAPASISCDRLDAHVERVALEQLALLQADASQAGGGVEDARRVLRDAERERDAFLSAMNAAGLGVDVYATGARERQTAVERAQAELRAVAARQVALPFEGSADVIWHRLSGHGKNQVLRGLLEAVVVRAAGRGRVLPVAERTRIVAQGAGLVPPGRAAGIRPVWPDVNGPGVLRELAGEDPLERPGG